MKKILITPGITDLNRGDQALIWLIRDMFQEAGIEASYKLLQSGNNEEDVYNQSKQSIKEGFDIIKPILLHPARGKGKKYIGYTIFTKLSWGITALGDLFKSLLLISRIPIFRKLGIILLDKEQKQTYKEFESMDCMVVKGGGFLHTYKRMSDIYYLYYSLFNLILAKKMGKKVIVMPNSFGPFMGTIEKVIIKKILSKCDLIYARENISKEYLSKIIDNKVFLSADLGFYIKKYNKIQYNEVSNINTLMKKVAITMRPYRFPESTDGEKKYELYIKSMYEVVKHLINKNYYPIFVAHTLGPSSHEDDRIAIEEVIKLLDSHGFSKKEYLYVNKDELNCYDITELYSNMDYVIGTRFHSVIFAMTSFVPSIAISYSGNKTIGIMNDIGLKDYTINILDINSKEIISKFDLLTKNEVDVKNKITKYMNRIDLEKDNILLDIKKII
ncbi:polysaccharide pyruvyl transferase family protein [Clostridium intestinale]|uniref:polysaccharide pyruvyl transferase family protein n=1 Tax=Clostridium intestinale TaxID=36845 RepID=UPI0028EABF50|nr:polysaccharide pyruvyl transferase family protein [Clostridium intestinale]